MTDLGSAEPCVPCGNDEVARNSEFETPGECVPLDCGDQRLVRQPIQYSQSPTMSGDRTSPVKERVQVGTGAEDATCAGDHSHAKVVVAFEQVHRLLESVGCAFVDGIPVAGSVECDQQSLAAALEEERWFDGSACQLRHDVPVT